MYYNLGLSMQLSRTVIEYIHESAYKREFIPDHRAADLADLLEPIVGTDRSNVRSFIEWYKKEVWPLIEEIERETIGYERIEQQ
jgi:hypothetical protein